MADLSIVKSEPLNTSGLQLVKSEPLPAPSGPGVLERGWNAFREWTPPAPASDWPELGPKFRQQLYDLYHGVAGIVPQTNAALQKTGDAMLRGDALDTVRQAPGIVPVVGPMTQQIGQDVEEGKYPEAAGHALNLGAQVVGPRAIAAAPRAAEAVVDAAKSVPPVVKAAVKAGGKDVLAGGAKTAAGAVLAKSGLLGEMADAFAGVRIGASGLKQVGQGARNGYAAGKAALTERVQAAIAKAKTASQPPAGLLASPAHAPAPPADTSFVRSVPAEYPPFQPAGLLPEAPRVTALGSGPDASFVRAVPGQYAESLPPEVMAELTRDSTAVDQAPAPAPAYSTRAQDLARELHEEMQRSGTAPSVEPAAAEPPPDYAAAPRAEKVGKLAQALHDGGIPLDDAKLMDASHWKMVADGIGVNVPGPESITETLAQLKRFAVSDALAELEKTESKLNPLQAAAVKEKAAAAARVRKLKPSDK